MDRLNSPKELSVQGVRKAFDGLQVLAGASFELHPGEILGLIGANGSGKTVLIDIIAGFQHPDEGRVLFGGTELTSAPVEDVVSAGLVRSFQGVRLVRRLTASENVALGSTPRAQETLVSAFGNSARRCSAANSEVLRALESVGLADEAETPAGNLSYGQRKLLSLACVFATGPVCILLDEPCAGLQAHWVERATEVLAEKRAQGCAVLLVEHDLELVRRLADRIVLLDGGKIALEGQPDEVLDDPRLLDSFVR